MRFGLIDKAVRTRALYQGTTALPQQALVVPIPIPKLWALQPLRNFFMDNPSDKHLAQVQARQGSTVPGWAEVWCRVDSSDLFLPLGLL
jgi:hypothetical protein